MILRSLWDILARFCAVYCINVLMRFPYESLWLLRCNCRMRFSFEIVCFLLHNFLVWFQAFLNRNEVTVWDLCFLALMKCHEICFAISLWFWVIMRFPYDLFSVLLDACLMRFHIFVRLMARRGCEIFFFLLHNFRAKYPNEKSCLFGPLRVLRMRFHACWAGMRFLD